MERHGDRDHVYALWSRAEWNYWNNSETGTVEDMGIQFTCMQHGGQQSGSDEDTGTAQTSVPNPPQRRNEGQSPSRREE